MRRFLPLPVVFGCLMMANFAQAATISIDDDYEAAPGGSIDILVDITGGEDIAALALGFSVGDGGPALGGGGIETLEISGIDYTTGTIWSPFSVTTGEGVPLSAQSATIANVSIDAPSTDATANGLLMTITLDLSTASVGEILDLDPNAGSQTSASNSDLQALTLNFDPGTLTIVPEPSTITLAGLVGLLASCWIGRRRRRRYSC